MIHFAISCPKFNIKEAIVINIGKINKLIVDRETNSGYYLRDTESDYEVFMPPSLATEQIVLGDEVKVFIYPDTTGSLIATQKLPVAQVGEYALLRAVSVQEFGSFFEWGIDKDLLVPGNEQKVKVKQNEYYLVRICIEEGTDRIYGSTKLGKFIEETVFDIYPGDKVNITPVQATDLGYKIIINKKYIGMIYSNEIFSPVRINQNYEGVVKKIREDKLVDASLQLQGIANSLSAKDKVLERLKKEGGFMKLHDKSSPEEIYHNLQMSKKTFKNAIGMLYKERLITIEDTGIRIK